LLLVCEEGIEEYDPDMFANDGVFLEYIEEESDLTEKYLLQLQRKHKAQRVMVEYNGMWKVDSLLENMPRSWILAQNFLFVDAGSFLIYNSNMRSLVVDKLNICELVVFNRFSDTYDKMQYHKIVRGTSRSTDIAYEYPDGRAEYDDIEDPLPFDINAPTVIIKDEDFAIWYRDMADNMMNYNGKTVRFKCTVNKKFDHTNERFVLGRDVMACCAEDISFTGLVCYWPEARNLKHKQWITVTATINIEYCDDYGREGPVLTAKKIVSAKKPEKEVATFF